MKNLILLTLISLVLVGCLQKIPVEQGNVITNENVSLLRKGMTEDDVRAVMGNPVLTNLFTPNRIEYVYTYQVGQNRTKEQRLSLIFAQGRLREILRY